MRWNSWYFYDHFRMSRRRRWLSGNEILKQISWLCFCYKNMSHVWSAPSLIIFYNCFSGCALYGIIGTYSGIGSAFCNAIIAYDRFRVITNPFSRSGMTMTKAVAILILIYLYITPFAILPALEIWSRYVPEGFLTSCSADFFMHDFNGRSYIVGTWFFGWFIPVAMIVFCYSQIFLAVKDHENKIKEQVSTFFQMFFYFELSMQKICKRKLTVEVKLLRQTI